MHKYILITLPHYTDGIKGELVGGWGRHMNSRGLGEGR